MLIFISGGVRSGKSALGEALVGHLATGRKVYLATAEAYDDEMTTRIARHRQDRAGKGFVTIERSRDLAAAAGQLQKQDAVLLDCLGTLAANEMFAGTFTDASTAPVDKLCRKIIDAISLIHASVAVLIVISNEVFSDGIDYEPMTQDYVRLLGKLHCELAASADTAVECASRCRVVHKGRLPESLQAIN